MLQDSLCLLSSNDVVGLAAGIPEDRHSSEQPADQASRWDEIDEVFHQLLPRMQRNDLAAWDEFFQVAWPLVFRTIFRLSGKFTHEDAEEISQDTLATVHASLDTFRGESKFRVWMLGIAWRKAQGRIAHQNARKRRGEQVELDSEIVDEAACRPSDAIAQKEDSERIRSALGRLQDHCREVIELRYFAELPYDELADLFGENVKTIGSRLSRCLAALGKLFHASRR